MNEEAPKDSVIIDVSNLERYGFSCFHYDGGQVIREGYWDRKIELVREPSASPKKTLFRIPEVHLACLSKEHKIIHHPGFGIDTVSDPVAAVKLLSERAGWNQTVEDLDAMQKQASDGMLLARYRVKNQHLVLGSGVSLPVSEDLAWIGMILVHPELRRQGIARAVMHKCLSYARLRQQKAIVGLDATPLGKQVYDSLGFKDSFLIWRSVLSTSQQFPAYSNSELLPLDPDEMRNYLLKKNYTDRLEVTECISNLPGSYNLQAKHNGELRGFALSRPGRLRPFLGTLLADSHETAMDLIGGIGAYWHGLGHNEMFMDIPEWHLSGRSIFETENVIQRKNTARIYVAPARSFMRMYQLIAPDQPDDMVHSGISEDLIKSAIDGYARTAIFVNKEKNDVVPIMYGTSGPEWS